MFRISKQEKGNECFWTTKTPARLGSMRPNGSEVLLASRFLR